MRPEAIRQEGPLSPEFPEVLIKTSVSFAHNRGDMVGVDSIEIAGETCASREALERLISARGGWSPDGGSGEDDVCSTLRAWVLAWAAARAEDVLTDGSAPEDLERLLPAPGDLPDYHPLQVELATLPDGERVVLATAYERGHIGQRGRLWEYRVEIYRVEDGRPVQPPPPPDFRGPEPDAWPLPRRGSFWQR
jgi:hypothetical protein